MKGHVASPIHFLFSKLKYFTQSLITGIVHPKIYILSFNYPQFVPNPYEFVSSSEKKKRKKKVTKKCMDPIDIHIILGELFL